MILVGVVYALFLTFLALAANLEIMELKRRIKKLEDQKANSKDWYFE